MTLEIELEVNPTTGKIEPEIWKVIPDCDINHEISNYGRVTANGRILPQCSDSDGYLSLNIKIIGKYRLIRVHRLVFSIFHGVKPKGYVIDHIDNVKTRNRAWNLQAITPRQNTSKDRPVKTSKYIGVCWNKKSKKWVASINVNGKDKYLGLYTSELEAAAHYQIALAEV